MVVLAHSRCLPRKAGVHMICPSQVCDEAILLRMDKSSTSKVAVKIPLGVALAIIGFQGPLAAIWPASRRELRALNWLSGAQMCRH